MDYLEKQKCLFVFKSLLYYKKADSVIHQPVYDNTQPSKSFEKTVFNLIFHDSMLDLIPHTKYGTLGDFKLRNKIIVLTVLGRMWPHSNYKFVNETDYIDTMKSVNFQTEPSELSQRDLFDDFISNYIGYGLVTKNKNKYVIDARYLKQFEIREGYSNLDCVIYLDEKMKFDYCKIKGQKRTDDFAIRECITAISTISTIEKHAFQIHFLITDKFNLLLNTVDKTNPVYRILIPITNKPYTVNEYASISLLGPTGFCVSFNLTRKGLGQYYEYTKQKFKIRDFLIPKELPGQSAIHKHQHLWYECIHNFVKEFLLIQTELDCDDFIKLLNKNYDGIYDDTKTKLENMIDICAMMIYSNIIHECYSNPTFSKLLTNPFTLSTTWKENDSSVISDKINNLGEQTEVNFIAYATSLEAIRMDDERWVNMCCVNDDEKVIWQTFRTAISKLEIPDDATLHSKNISSSVSY
jgi:hypothetical protein